MAIETRAWVYALDVGSRSADWIPAEDMDEDCLTLARVEITVDTEVMDFGETLKAMLEEALASQIEQRR